MNEISSDKLLEAWENGVWLASALEKLASPEQKKVLQNDKANSITDMMQKAIVLSTKNQNEGGSGFLSTMSSLLEDRNATVIPLLNDLRSAFLNFARSQEIHVLGFEAPRKFNDTPILIPFSYLRDRILWEKNIVEHESLKFVDVRMSDWQVGELRLDANRQKTTGRTSQRHLYFECFQALNSSGKLDLSGTKSANFPAARIWLHRNHPRAFPDPQSGSDKTIRKYFNMFLDELHLNS